MSEKSSSTTNNLIMALISGAPATLIVYADDVKVTILMVTFILLMFIAVNFNFLRRRYYKLKLRIPSFLNVITEKQKMHIEFLDRYGKIASLDNKSYFRKFKTKTIYNGEVSCDGRIYLKGLLNCTSNPNYPNKVKIFYGGIDHRTEYSEYKSNSFFYGYSLELLDSFPNKTEYWDIETIHYIKAYEQDFVFFKSNPPKNVRLIEFLKNKEGKIITDSNGVEQYKVLKIEPLITMRFGKIVMKVRLFDLPPEKTIRIFWDWDKPK